MIYWKIRKKEGLITGDFLELATYQAPNFVWLSLAFWRDRQWHIGFDIQCIFDNFQSFLENSHFSQEKFQKLRVILNKYIYLYIFTPIHKDCEWIDFSKEKSDTCFYIHTWNYQNMQDICPWNNPILVADLVSDKSN